MGVEPQQSERPVFGDLGTDAELGEEVEGVERVPAVLEQLKEVDPRGPVGPDELAPQVAVDDE